MTCAIYIRKSREEKDKPAHRLDVQRQQLPAHALQQGWTPIVYDDGHASAARGKVAELPERARLERDIRAGKIDIILTIELSRLSRDDTGQDFHAWLALCVDHNVKLATLTQVYDPSEITEYTFLRIADTMSASEMLWLRKRMQEGRTEARRAGRYITGTPPFPYVYDKQAKRPEPHPEWVEQAKQVWKLCETHSARKISDETGLDFTKVRRLLCDDRLQFCQGLATDPETGEAVQGQWDAILTTEQAEKIRQWRRGGHTGGERKGPGALLSGLKLLYCGYCGRTVHRWRNNRPKNDGTVTLYYGCNSKRLASTCPKSSLTKTEILEEKLVASLVNTLANIDGLKAAWLASREGEGTDKERPTLEKRQAKLQQQKERLVTAIAEGVIEFADARQKRAKIDTELAAIGARLHELQVPKTNEPDWDNLSLTKKRFDEFTFNEKRELLPTLIKEIRLFSSDMLVTYQFPRANGDPTVRVKFEKKRTKRKSRKNNN